ncbi:hypothetical protein CBR_g33940 [Chara braunii]|uniref:Uncharacterized protein n=1 Tax=Chara braunii TaxID=69332 RepID=A0A388LHR7_CHABU|nr:hypothetical protein CBR_g33940 [Chara braunii]|eukprot:GBG81762.1 hypothetical protein CBR_g33940 [Chara braunii]
MAGATGVNCIISSRCAHDFLPQPTELSTATESSFRERLDCRPELGETSYGSRHNHRLSVAPRLSSGAPPPFSFRMPHLYSERHNRVSAMTCNMCISPPPLSLNCWGLSSQSKLLPSRLPSILSISSSSSSSSSSLSLSSAPLSIALLTVGSSPDSNLFSNCVLLSDSDFFTDLDALLFGIVPGRTDLRWSGDLWRSDFGRYSSSSPSSSSSFSSSPSSSSQSLVCNRRRSDDENGYGDRDDVDDDNRLVDAEDGKDVQRRTRIRKISNGVRFRISSSSTRSSSSSWPSSSFSSSSTSSSSSSSSVGMRTIRCFRDDDSPFPDRMSEKDLQRLGRGLGPGRDLQFSSWTVQMMDQAGRAGGGSRKRDLKEDTGGPSGGSKGGDGDGGGDGGGGGGGGGDGDEADDHIYLLPVVTLAFAALHFGYCVAIWIKDDGFDFDFFRTGLGLLGLLVVTACKLNRRTGVDAYILGLGSSVGVMVWTGERCCVKRELTPSGIVAVFAALMSAIFSVGLYHSV